MPFLLVLGLLLLIGAVALLYFWLGYLWIIFKAAAPLVLLAAGAVITYFGWEEWRENKSPIMDFSNPDEEKRYQTEAQAMQKEIDGLKNGDDD